MSLSPSILTQGIDVPLPEETRLVAGPLSLTFVAGEVRNIELQGYEVLSRIYLAVRDRHWRRVPSIVTELYKEISADLFQVTFEMENVQAGIDFLWRGCVIGRRDGSLMFRAQGRARSSFWKNRIGFCVLHSSKQYAGRSCTIETSDGAVVRGSFPSVIAPHQPFLDIRAITHDVQPGMQSEIRFEGETFEMEDQRNWGDASFKIYCTPLGLPHPVEIKKGVTVLQSVGLSIQGLTALTAPSTRGEAISIELDEDHAVPMPKIGLAMSDSGRPLTPIAISRLRQLNLSHLRVDLTLSEEGYEAQLERASKESDELSTAIECALFLSDEAAVELRNLRACIDTIRPRIATWLIFNSETGWTTQSDLAKARDTLQGYDSAAKFGGGTDRYFAEINRSRTAATAATLQADDLISYSLNPQVHAGDNLSLIENLAAQSTMVEGAKSLFGVRSVSVSPITLKPRRKGKESKLQCDSRNAEGHDSSEPRQFSLFGAAWTLGSLKQLAEAAAYSATYYETVGPNGIMPGENPAGVAVYPMYHVFADIADFTDGLCIPSRSSQPLKIEVFAVGEQNRMRIMLANFTAVEQRVHVVSGTLLSRAFVKLMDGQNARLATHFPESFRDDPKGSPLQVPLPELEVPPHGLMRLDLE